MFPWGYHVLTGERAQQSMAQLGQCRRIHDANDKPPGISSWLSLQASTLLICRKLCFRKWTNSLREMHYFPEKGSNSENLSYILPPNRTIPQIYHPPQANFPQHTNPSFVSLGHLNILPDLVLPTGEGRLQGSDRACLRVTSRAVRTYPRSKSKPQATVGGLVSFCLRASF